MAFIPATAKQINFLTKLATERGYHVADGIMSHPGRAATMPLKDITKAMASSMIDGLLSQPKIPAQVAATEIVPAQRKAAAELTDGMYQLSTGEIFKVVYAANGSGRLYAKALVVTENVDEDPEIRFSYAPGAIRRLTPADKMTKEAARAFGKLYGVCCICGRTLTDEESIGRGTGKVCDGRM